MRMVMAASVAAAMGAGQAGAATIDLNYNDGVYPGGDAPFGIYVVNGVTVSPDNESGFNATHIDDGGSMYPRSLTYSMDDPFSAVSVAFSFADSVLFACHDDDEVGQACEPYSYAFISISGYQDDTLVASALLDASVEGTTFTFGAEFAGIDSLTFTVAPQPNAPDGASFLCLDSPCSHYTFESLVLTAPVPLPASAPVFAVALVGFGLVRRRRP